MKYEIIMNTASFHVSSFRLSTFKTFVYGLLMLSSICARAVPSTTIVQHILDATIPDANPVGVIDTISPFVGATRVVTAIKLSLVVEGGSNGDLYVQLSHAGRLAIILNRVGLRPESAIGYSDGGFSAVFTDTAANHDIHVYRLVLFGNHVTPVGGQLTGEWQPDGRPIGKETDLSENARTVMLSQFLGRAAAGDWTLFAADLDGVNESVLKSWTLEIQSDEPAVVGRKIFYNNSLWDGKDPTANSDDDGAVATDKAALLPGDTASFVNYTSYSRGINGIMVDIANLPGAPSIADFVFKVGNDNSPAAWALAPAPSSVMVRAGAGEGGASRISIVWPNSPIQQQWLQVTVQATAETGLASPDVFYFGNAIGDVGNSPNDGIVNAADQLIIRNNATLVGGASVTSPFDLNRDTSVNAGDRLIARNNANTAQSALQLIRPTAARSIAVKSFPREHPSRDLLDDQARRLTIDRSLDSVDAEPEYAIRIMRVGIVGDYIEFEIEAIERFIIPKLFEKNSLDSNEWKMAPDAIQVNSATEISRPFIRIPFASGSNRFFKVTGKNARGN